jgi:hypothetical protein
MWISHLSHACYMPLSSYTPRLALVMSVQWLGYGLDGRSLTLDTVRDRFQADSGVHPPPIQRLPARRVKRPCRCVRCVEIYPHSSIRLHCVVLS